MSGRNTGGLHIEAVGSHTGYGDYLSKCAAAGKPVGMVKAFFDGGALMQAKSVSSQTITIWRGRPRDTDSDNPHPEQDWLWPPSMNAQYADEWMTALLERWTPDRAVTDYLEIVNEPNGGGIALQFENQRDFFICCMQWADLHGFKIAIGSFSSGCPEDWQTAILAPSFDYAAHNGHIVSLHDGSVDESRPLFSQAAVDGTAYRYRWYNRVLDNLSLKHPRYAITEGYRPSGYKGMNASGWADMQAYLQELARDGVLGWAWFTLGDYDFGGGIVNVVGQLGKYGDMLASTTWPDEIVPPPPPELEQPIIVNVPYLNQNSISANLSVNDCGPACEAMIARYLTGDLRTVNDWYMATGAGLGLISIQEMQLAAQRMGYTLNVLRGQNLATLRTALDNKRPCILLVNPVGLRACGTTAPHFIVCMGYSKITGVFYCHDPYFITGGIGGAMIEQPTLAEAWSRCHEQGNPDWLMMTMDIGTLPHPVSTAWRGLQLRNGDNTTDDWACVVIGKLDAVKFTTDTSFDDLDYACTLVPPHHVLLRLFADLDGRVVLPHEFASWFGLWLDKFASVGGQYVEVHNEPNLYQEGLGQSWTDGATFGAWLIGVIEELREIQPNLKYGFPGLSPGGAVEGVRMDEAAFYNGARPAVAACDWLGVHCYWLTAEAMTTEADGGHYKVYANEGKPLLITEFSNPWKRAPKADKGRQYKAYYASLPSYVIGAYSFISSASNPAFSSETWAGSDIPMIVGS